MPTAGCAYALLNRQFILLIFSTSQNRIAPVSDYADEQYGYFQQLASSLRRFNTKFLAKMVDAGIAPGSSAMSRWLSPMVAVGGSIFS